MAKYRKKPVVIEAVQFTQELVNGYCLREEAIPKGVLFKRGAWNTQTETVYNAEFYIPTLEGEMTVSVGDWIITGVNGEHYPCKPDIFEKTYEEVK